MDFSSNRDRCDESSIFGAATKVGRDLVEEKSSFMSQILNAVLLRYFEHLSIL